MPAFEDQPPVDDAQTYHQIFRTLDVGLARVNLEGYLIEVNARFARLLGHRREAMVGLHIADFTHPEDLAASLTQMDAALSGDPRPFAMHQRFIHADGRLVKTRIRAILLRDAEGHPLQFVSAVHESTDMAHAAAPAAGFDVIAGMSHALRTPLNAMLGFAQLLRVDPSQSLSPGQSDKIGHIEQSGAQLLALLSDVIDLARLEAQHLPLQIQQLPLAAVLDDALSDVAALADETGVRVQRQLSSPLLCVWADRDRLRQIVRRLLHHALRASESGGLILLEAQALNHQVAITVSETGHALSAAQQAELFDMPSPGHPSGPSDGTHLGLHISKRLVELMRGRVEVTSDPGVGTRLRIWLPQSQSTSPTSEDPFTHSSAFSDIEGQASEQPLSVLYAEDNVVNIELVRQVMRMRPQWRLEVAYSGQDAISMALRDPPDLLLLDMHLGDMGGLDVSDVLARHAYTAHIPRVALSADVLPDHIREARTHGFVDYLTKPLDVERLLRLLDRVAQLKAS